MSLIDLNLGEVPDQEAVPEGEYTLRITNAEVKTSEKTGGQYISMTCAIEGEPNAYPVSYVLMLPSATDAPEVAMSRKRRIKKFLEALGHDPSQPFDPEDLVGSEFQAILNIEESDEYGVRNRVRRLL